MTQRLLKGSFVRGSNLKKSTNHECLAFIIKWYSLYHSVLLISASRSLFKIWRSGWRPTLVIEQRMYKLNSITQKKPLSDKHSFKLKRMLSRLSAFNSSQNFQWININIRTYAHTHTHTYTMLCFRMSICVVWSSVSDNYILLKI